MGDPPSDLSQEDHLDHLNPSLQSFGSDLPTSRFAAGPGISSQFTTQGAPSGARNQRLAESASNLVQDPRSLDSSNTSHPSQFEHALSGSHRGVNTDGSSPADSLGSSNNNPRSQHSTGNASRFSPSVGAFAAAQVHAFGTHHLENRIRTISRNLQQHHRGRDPSEQDVHLIALLIANLPSDEPDLINQHILDAVLPLSADIVKAITLPIQRGERPPASAVDALGMRTNLIYHSSYSPLSTNSNLVFSPHPFGHSGAQQMLIHTPTVDSGEAAPPHTTGGSAVLSTPAAGHGGTAGSSSAAAGESLHEVEPSSDERAAGALTKEVLNRVDSLRTWTKAALPTPEQEASEARIKEALITLETLKPDLSAADHSALTIQLYNDELAILNGQPSAGLDALNQALDASRLRAQLDAHRVAAFEDALSEANRHPYYGSSLARIVKTCHRMGLDPLAALATATATFNSAPYLPAQSIITEAISHLASGEVAKFNDAWYPAVQKFSEKQSTSSILGAASNARSCGLPRSPSAPQVTAPPLISGIGFLGESMRSHPAQYLPPHNQQPVRTLFDTPLANFDTSPYGNSTEAAALLERAQRAEESLRLVQAARNRDQAAELRSAITRMAKDTWNALQASAVPRRAGTAVPTDADEEAYYSGASFAVDDNPPPCHSSGTPGAFGGSSSRGGGGGGGAGVSGVSAGSRSTSPPPRDRRDTSPPPRDRRDTWRSATPPSRDRRSPGPSGAATMCEELGLSPTLISGDAKPLWYTELDLATHGLDTSAVVTEIESYVSRFLRALRGERRRSTTLHLRPPHHESTLKEYIVIPSKDGQSFASNYGRTLECLLDLFFVHLFQEAEVMPAANLTLSFLSNLAMKIPDLSSSSSTVVRLEPNKRSGHDGIQLVLREITLHYLSGSTESGEQRFYCITWENNAEAARGTAFGNTAAHLWGSLVSSGVPINKTEAQICARWRSVVNNTAERADALGAHASQVAAIYTRAGGAGVNWNTFAQMRPTFDPQTGQPIAARVPLPTLETRRPGSLRPPPAGAFAMQGLGGALPTEEVNGALPTDVAGAGAYQGGGGPPGGHAIKKPKGHLANFRKAVQEGRVRAWSGIVFPPLVNKNRADGYYTLDCPRCLMKETKALENQAKGLPFEMTFKDFFRHTGSSPSETNKPSELGIVVSHPLEYCHHVKMDLVFHVRNNPADAHYLEEESFPSFKVRFDAARLAGTETPA